MFLCILLMRIGFEFWYFWYFVFDLTVFWVLLVDCVRVSEFDHGFVYVFACLDVKKMK